MIQQKKVLNELLLMISIDDDEENRIVESRNFSLLILSTSLA